MSLGDAQLMRLRTIVCQIAPSDQDPLWDSSETEESAFKSVDERLGELSEPSPSE
jgi:hypothetical protein